MLYSRMAAMKNYTYIVSYYFLFLFLYSKPFSYDNAMYVGQQGKWQETYEKLNKLLIDQPERADYLYDSAVAASHINNITQAYSYFLKAAEHALYDDLKGKAFYNAANMAVALKDLPRAVELYDSALAINENDEYAKHNRTIVEEMIKQQEQQEKQNKKDQEEQQKKDEQQQNQSQKNNQENNDDKSDDNKNQQTDDQQQNTNDQQQQKANNQQQNNKDQQQNSSKQNENNQQSSNENGNDQEKNNSEERSSEQKKDQEKHTGSNTQRSHGQEHRDEHEQTEQRDNAQRKKERDAQEKIEKESHDKIEKKDAKQQGKHSDAPDDKNQKEGKTTIPSEKEKVQALDPWLLKILDEQEEKDKAVNKQLMQGKIRRGGGRNGQNNW